MAKHSSDINVHVAVVEPNPVEREYLLALVAGAPGVTLTEGYGDLATALPEFEKDPPDMVVADLGDAAGYAATWLQRLHANLPHTSVLVLSTEKTRDQLFEAMEAGVSGWLQKPCTADQILGAIIILQEGGAILSSSVARKILEYFHTRGNSVGSLSPREREILSLLDKRLQAAGNSEGFGLSQSTTPSNGRNTLPKYKGGPQGSRAKHVKPPL